MSFGWSLVLFREFFKAVKIAQLWLIWLSAPNSSSVLSSLGEAGNVRSGVECPCILLSRASGTDERHRTVCLSPLLSEPVPLPQWWQLLVVTVISLRLCVTVVSLLLDANYLLKAMSDGCMAGYLSFLFISYILICILIWKCLTSCSLWSGLGLCAPCKGAATLIMCLWREEESPRVQVRYIHFTYSCISFVWALFPLLCWGLLGRSDVGVTTWTR